MTVDGVESPAESAARSRISARVPMVAEGATASAENRKPNAVLRTKARRPTESTHTHRTREESASQQANQRGIARARLQRKTIEFSIELVCDVFVQGALAIADRMVAPPTISAGYCLRTQDHCLAASAHTTTARATARQEAISETLRSDRSNRETHSQARWCCCAVV